MWGDARLSIVVDPATAPTVSTFTSGTNGGAYTNSTTATSESRQKPAPLTSRHNRQRQRKHHQQQQHQRDQSSDYKPCWHPGHEDPYSALGITNAIQTYRAHQGKTTRPLPQTADISHLEESRRITIIRVSSPPPITVRNRKSQLGLATIRPVSSFTDDADSDPEGYNPLVHVAALAGDMPQSQMLEQISPPSSPEVVASRKVSIGDVSPIDEDSDASIEELLLTGYHSQLPSHQRYQSSSLPTAAQKPSTKVLQSVSGSTSRKPVPPRMYKEQQRASSQASSYQPTFTIVRNPGPQPPSKRADTASPSFGQRVKRLGREAANALENRPPWKGASGREPQLKALRDDLTVAPLNIPPRNNRRFAARDGQIKARPASMAVSQPAKPADKSGGRATTAMRKFLPSKEPGKPSQRLSRISDALSNRRASTISPTPPPPNNPIRERVRPNLSSVAATAATTTTTTNSPSTPVGTPIKRKPPPLGHSETTTPYVNPLASSPVNASDLSAARPNSANDAVSVTVSEPEEIYQQPASRFSITTFATSQATKTPSITQGEANIPTLDESQLATPIVRPKPLLRSEGGRARAVSESPVLGIKTKFNDTKRVLHNKSSRDGLKHVKAASESVSPSHSDSSVSSAKPLPPAPPEVCATDRIGHLDAQLHGLANRQMNIERGIKKMTELMPTDNILASAAVIRKREQEKKKIENLRSELAEIQREQHELGFQRHRAYKRMDKEAKYEPTSLWVRRVAS